LSGRGPQGHPIAGAAEIHDRSIIRCCSFTDTATTQLHTLSLHDALPISAEVDRRQRRALSAQRGDPDVRRVGTLLRDRRQPRARSEEHTSELQSLRHLVCRLLLEKKKRTPSSWSPPVCSMCSQHRSPSTP